MYEIRSDGKYYWVVIIRDDLGGNPEEVPSGLGLWLEREGAQSVCDKKNKASRYQASKKV